MLCSMEDEIVEKSMQEPYLERRTNILAKQKEAAPIFEKGCGALTSTMVTYI